MKLIVLLSCGHHLTPLVSLDLYRENRDNNHNVNCFQGDDGGHESFTRSRSVTQRFSVEPGDTTGAVEVWRMPRGDIWRLDEAELFTLCQVINDFIATSPEVQRRYMERLIWVGVPSPPIKMAQHCTSEECPYTQFHAARWCGYEQPRRCGCPYCYEDER